VQIVVNCETRLCSQFLGPGDHFFAKLWCDFYGSGSDRIGQSEKFNEYSSLYCTYNSDTAVVSTFRH
jgi:hypothetical protein